MRYDVIALSATQDINSAEVLALCCDVSYPENSNSPLCSFELNLFGEQPMFGNQRYLLDTEKWNAFKIGNLITSFRISNAIGIDAEPKMLQQVLDPSMSSITNPQRVILSRASIAYRLSLGLNRSQRSALQEVMSFSGISIIQGPPGILIYIISRHW
jgi:hypothetical protein